ncbi:MAG: hypothetical protein AMXMBFR16_11100 [Candidatus Uhrbacteria bacterium]
MNVNYLLTQLDELTAHDALQILSSDFACGNTRVQFVRSKAEYTVDSMLGWKHFNSIKASVVGPIWIMAGPPNAHEWYTGTLVTLVADRILRDHVHTGSYSDLIYERDGIACPF